MIDMERLSYTYPNGERPALRDVSLQVAAGQFLLIAGPSGSGKSTLLRCANGLVPHFSGGAMSGRIRVNGLDPVAQGPQAMSQHVGFVMQDPEAQAVLERVEPEIAFGLENAAVPRQEMRVRVEEVLELLDLAHLRNRELAKLSGGERQRVAIASALAFRPQILALDEPTSQLDPQSAAEVLQALARLNEDLGLTILLAEHRLERVLRYVDRIVALEQGRIVVDDEPRAAAGRMAQLPPLPRLARELGWEPTPLTVKEGRPFALKKLSGKASTGNGASGNQADKARAISSAAGDLLLRAKDIHFSYNGERALRGVDLGVARGEAVALIGRNGSGKSTLLKCLVGLLGPSQGQVLVNGRANDGREVADICREVAYLPQNPDDLLFADSVAEEVAITRRNHGMLADRSLIVARLATLGLDHVASAYPRDLSVGERQRVAFGAVTAVDPKLILLDEPTRGLDYDVKQTLVRLWQRWLERGAGLLLVTHDVELAAMIAQRVLVMSDGEIIAEGDAAEVLSASPLFAPQVARLFPGQGWLTVEDAMAAFQDRKKEDPLN